MGFGVRFREAREELGLSQDRLASRLGVSKTTISAWERGDKLPESQRLPEIRKQLRRSIDWLYGVDADTTAVHDEHVNYFTPHDKQLAALFAKLSDRKQQALFDLLADDED